MAFAWANSPASCSFVETFYCIDRIGMVSRRCVSVDGVSIVHCPQMSYRMSTWGRRAENWNNWQQQWEMRIYELNNCGFVRPNGLVDDLSNCWSNENLWQTEKWEKKNAVINMNWIRWTITMSLGSYLCHTYHNDAVFRPNGSAYVSVNESIILFIQRRMTHNLESHFDYLESAFLCHSFATNGTSEWLQQTETISLKNILLHDIVHGLPFRQCVLAYDCAARLIVDMNCRIYCTYLDFWLNGWPSVRRMHCVSWIPCHNWRTKMASHWNAIACDTCVNWDCSAFYRKHHTRTISLSHRNVDVNVVCGLLSCLSRWSFSISPIPLHWTVRHEHKLDAVRPVSTGLVCVRRLNWFPEIWHRRRPLPIRQCRR